MTQNIQAHQRHFATVLLAFFFSNNLTEHWWYLLWNLIKQTSFNSNYLCQVLYDGLCPVCVAEIRFLQFLQRKKPGRVDFIDISLPGYDGAKHRNVSYEMAMEVMHVIDEKDEVRL